MATLAKQIAELLAEKHCARVTALDFTDVNQRANELGRFLAEQLAVELVAVKGITVLDRRNIASIMAEHQLTAEGLVKPENAKKLGQFSGVESIVLGVLASIDNRIVLTVKAISTETAEVVAGGRASIPATPDLQRMLGLSVVAGSPTGGQTAGGTAFEGEAIATRQLGPIGAVLRNVVQFSIQTDGQSSPAIRCTFDLENRDLRRSVAVAANQRMEGMVTRLTYRGDGVDSNGTQWRVADARGIAGLSCGNYNAGVSQPNPGGIVDYIRTTNKVDSEKELQSSTRFWVGSFATIPPGESVRMTVDLVPQVATDHRRSAEQFAWPAHFQFDMELVTGTFVEGEDPTKAKDLLLRNLTIDRITLADQPKK